MVLMAMGYRLESISDILYENFVTMNCADGVGQFFPISFEIAALKFKQKQHFSQGQQCSAPSYSPQFRPSIVTMAT